MSKKPAKAAAPAKDAKHDVPPRRRSKLKLALVALVPLMLLAGGGYAGWTFLLAGNAAGTAHAAEGGDGAGPGRDDITVASLPAEVTAETSFTHSFALSVLMAKQCGARSMPALEAASRDEARTNGQLVNLSWLAASRRAEAFTGKSCNLISSELVAAERKAATVRALKDMGFQSTKAAVAVRAGTHH